MKYSSWVFLFIIFFGLGILSLHAQQVKKEKENKPFIQKGKVLTNFSFSFINSSRSKFGRNLERELTSLVFQLEGLYFINKHIGIGPLLGYTFQYYDFVNSFGNQDIDVRISKIKFGIKAGYYLSVNEVLSGKNDCYLFTDFGIRFSQNIFRREGRNDINENFLFGYQIGVGILIPMGKQITIMTKLSFQQQKEEYGVPRFNPNSELIYVSKKCWTKSLAFTVGLGVTF